MPDLWTRDADERFFRGSLERGLSVAQLFYTTHDGRKLAYWPKAYKKRGATLQSRNAPIGDFTEQFAADLLEPLAEATGTRVVRNVVCEEIGLGKQSPADVGLCTSTHRVQRAENIRLIVEVKMSVVWNWELLTEEGIYKLRCIGDYTTHSASPSILRSDTVLKAIGKSINVRVSSWAGAGIPIIVLANTPIAPSYYDKADHLKQAGILQGFWSVNPAPRDGSVATLKQTPGAGFMRFESYEEFHNQAANLLAEDRIFFSAMKGKAELGKVIQEAAAEPTLELKAVKLISLLRSQP